MIGDEKAKTGSQIYDPIRENEVQRIIMDNAQQQRVDLALITELWEIIFRYSRAAQTREHERVDDGIL